MAGKRERKSREQAAAQKDGAVMGQVALRADRYDTFS
jgi:hypothetical protein